MARNQKNFSYQLYVANNGDQYNVRGEDGGAASAIDGHAAFDGSKPLFGRMTRRRHVRYIIFQDPVTFRTVKPIFYTETAFNAVAYGDTVAVSVAGLATTVNYLAIDKISERIPGARASRELADS